MDFKRLTIVCLLLLSMAATASADDDETLQVVKVGFGSLTLHMNLQVGLNYYVGDETLGQYVSPYDDPDDPNDTPDPYNGFLQANDRRETYEFVLNRFRFVTKGHIITDKITYFTQTEFAADGVELYDLYLSFHYIPFTSLSLGRTIPNYGFFTDRSTTDLIFIDYPLYGLKFMMGTGDSARNWRHDGLWFHLRSEYIDAQLGVWNGFTGEDTDGDGVSDNLRGSTFADDTNTGKDVTFSVTGKPATGLQIRASMWWGQPLAGYENEDGELIEFDNTVWLFGGGVLYLAPFGLRLGAEYHHRILSLADFDLQQDPDPESYTSNAWYGFAGFNLGHYTGVPVEFLARFDYYDANTDNRDDKPSVIGVSDSLHDQEWIVTGAINYYIEGLHAVIRLNYVHKHEDWRDVVNKKGDDTQTGIDNDIAKLQVQVAF